MGFIMKKREYTELQKKLEEAAENNNQTVLVNLLKNNRELINNIINEFGSGNIFLLKPYDILYSNHHYETSGLYQDTIEEINPRALLGEDN